MRQHKHFPHYAKSLVDNARRLRRELTDAEKKLWSALRGKQLQLNFRRQVPFDRYILDFYCPKANLIIEVDGGQHYTKEGIERDRERDLYLQGQGLKILRFSDRDVLMNISSVQQKIFEEIKYYLKNEKKVKETPPQSSPKRGGRNRGRSTFPPTFRGRSGGGLK